MKMKNIQIVDWGLIPYLDGWTQQKQLFNEILTAKQNKVSNKNYLVFCEHPHVYTLGKNGKISNMLHTSEFYKHIGATYVEIERGGDVTYHGPGQLVVYPIINLEDFHIGIKEYIFILEEAVICTCRHFNILATRVDHAIGVWIDPDGPNARKICAIGVKCSRFVSMHGLALNVNTDLNFFNHINPCGYVDKSVTSMEKELGEPLNFEEVETILRNHLVDLLDEHRNRK